MPRMSCHCENKGQPNQSQEAKFTDHKRQGAKKWNDGGVGNQE